MKFHHMNFRINLKLIVSEIRWIFTTLIVSSIFILEVETPMEKNCIGKSAMSYVLGGAMGLIMAMFMNAV